MAKDLSRVIVTIGATAHTSSIYHRDFPEIRAEGENPVIAAAHLANQLTRALDSALTQWRRETIGQAIADVRAFVPGRDLRDEGRSQVETHLDPLADDVGIRRPTGHQPTVVEANGDAVECTDRAAGGRKRALRKHGSDDAGQGQGQNERCGHDPSVHSTSVGRRAEPGILGG